MTRRNTHSIRSGFILRFAVWLLSPMFALTATAGEPKTTATARSTFRFGVSTATFSGVNENDAWAAMKAWTQILLKERGLPVDPEPISISDQAAMAKALKAQEIDAVALNADEFWEIDRHLRADPFLAGATDGSITETYMLLVHHDSPIRQLADLRGRTLLFLQTSRTSLAPAWLDTVLVQAGFPRTDAFCRITRIAKLSAAVLPVYFRKADACVITARGFKSMSELNPQLGKRLRPMAVSPEYVPSGFCFRHDYREPLKERIIAELSAIKNSPAGIQVMTLFQSGSLEAHPVSCLDSAFALLDLHRKLCGPSRQPFPADADAGSSAVVPRLPPVTQGTPK